MQNLSLHHSTGTALSECTTSALKIQVSLLENKCKENMSTSTGSSAHGVDFIGNMPVNLSRKSLTSTIQRRSYFVTEKTDGVRYLLYIVKDAGTGQSKALLQDRKGALYSMPASESIGNAIGSGTVLGMFMPPPLACIDSIVEYRNYTHAASPLASI